MGRRSATPAEAPSTEALTQSATQLEEQVKELTGQIHVLRIVLDEIRDELGWALNNGYLRCQEPRSVLHVTSMPLDPLAPDFAEGVNQLKPDEMLPKPEDDEEEEEPPQGPATPGSLF